MPYHEWVCAFIMEKVKIPEYLNIPVVVLTAYNEMEPAIVVRRHNSLKRIFLKPLKLQDLMDKVTEFVGQPLVPTTMIQDNIRKVFSDIEETCRQANRDPKDVIVVGVTKTVAYTKSFRKPLMLVLSILRKIGCRRLKVNSHCYWPRIRTLKAISSAIYRQIKPRMPSRYAR